MSITRCWYKCWQRQETTWVQSSLLGETQARALSTSINPSGFLRIAVLKSTISSSPGPTARSLTISTAVNSRAPSGTTTMSLSRLWKTSRPEAGLKSPLSMSTHTPTTGHTSRPPVCWKPSSWCTVRPRNSVRICPRQRRGKREWKRRVLPMSQRKSTKYALSLSASNWWLTHNSSPKAHGPKTRSSKN